MDKAAVTQIRDEIITALLPHVPFDGWAWEAVIAAAEQAGHQEQVARAVFPEQIVSVLDGFADWADRKMLAALPEQPLEEMRIRDRVSAACMLRYEVLQPHKEAMRKSLAFWAIPTRKSRAAKMVWRTADRIWHWAGDTATDYNRYTKRALLSGVIVSTTLAWMNDGQETLGQTQAFLDRRIENVLQLGKMVGQFKPFKAHKRT